jgi:hypothetical protein
MRFYNTIVALGVCASAACKEEKRQFSAGIDQHTEAERKTDVLGQELAAALETVLEERRNAAPPELKDRILQLCLRGGHKRTSQVYGYYAGDFSLVASFPADLVARAGWVGCGGLQLEDGTVMTFDIASRTWARCADCRPRPLSTGGD